MVSESIFGPGISDEKDWAAEMQFTDDQLQDGLPPDAILFGMGPSGENEDLDRES